MQEKVQEVIAKVMLALLVSCGGQAPTTSPESTIPSYTDVTPKEAYEIISQQEVVVLDVRTQEEYDSGHISNALLIPVSELESRLHELSPSDHILEYCRSGNRSEQADNILVANDFIHAYNMVGGIIEWQAQGFPVTQETKCPTCGS